MEFRNSYIGSINVLFAWFCIQSRVKQHLTLIFFWKFNIEVSYLSTLENILSYNSVTETSCSRMWRQRIRVISISLKSYQSYQSDVSKLSHLLQICTFYPEASLESKGKGTVAPRHELQTHVSISSYICSTDTSNLASPRKNFLSTHSLRGYTVPMYSLL